MKMKTVTEQTKEQLEHLIDIHGIGYVLRFMAEIMGEKAEHVRENWQDEVLAKALDKQSKAVEKLGWKFSERA
jgi:hypothetical protein